MNSVRNLLVANRGEIARRVFHTARRMGLATTAVFSDADADAPHVAEADGAVRLPGNTPGETYLRSDLLIAAARAAGADAIHPGYGFLSENAGFARDVLDAGLTWVGPPVKAIESMGSKVESKRLMAQAGVPVLDQLDPDAITEAELPVLIKASAGGGGRGMRVVRALDELPGQLDAARREAESAFGDPTVFCERYIETGRHIEVQIMADRHGTVWAVGERECSIQRRHQKVVEEAPSPLVQRIDGAGGDMRTRLFDAAQIAASAIGYEGAGTVEFLANEKGEFFFLEMNTRLQVEHPVTENTTGLDLVRLQLQIADGHVLGPEPPALRGHSIEVRLYAEDPAHGWRPQSGLLEKIEFDSARQDFAVLTETGVRLDSGVTDGAEVSIFYDPMLAKVISYASTRTEAAGLLAASLSRARLHGLITNRDLLVRVLRHPAFLAGDTDTAFFDTHGLAELAAPIASSQAVWLSAVAAALAQSQANREAARVDAGIPGGWRNLPAQPQSRRYRTADDRELVVHYRNTRHGLVVATAVVETAEDAASLTVVAAGPDTVVLDVGGENGTVRRRFAVAHYDDLVCVDSPLGPVQLTREPRFVDPAGQIAAGSLLAPMPGSVIRVGAEVGDRVDAGTPILWLEAMKMEHTIAAPTAGVLAELNVTVGQQVEVGAVLALVEEPVEAEEQR